MAAPFAIELPPVTRALDAVAFDLTACKSTATVRAGVTQTARRAVAFAVKNEIQAEHSPFQGRVAQLGTCAYRVPEVDKHGISPCERSI
jgi:hypothetical protein